MDELIKALRVCVDKDKDCSDCPYYSKCMGNDSEKHKLSRENESLAKSVNEASEILRKRWIPVEERLPNQYDGRLYICLIVGGEYDQLSWYELCDFAEGRFWTQESEIECHVTHWMPLPQPPKEE